MNKTQRIVHGGLCVVTLVSVTAQDLAFMQSPAYAQQGVNIVTASPGALGTVAVNGTVTVGNALTSVADNTTNVVGTTSYGSPVVPHDYVLGPNVWVPLHVCQSYTAITVNTTAAVQAIASASGSSIYLCDWEFSVQANLTAILNLQQGTSGTCSNNSSVVGIPWYLNPVEGKAAVDPFFRGQKLASGNGLCVVLSTTGTASVGLFYDQY